SVKSTEKITRAMKMVSAAKLRRAQVAILQARPYAHKLLEVLSDLAQRAGGAAAHPLLARRPERKIMLLVLTSDRGLCGGFNSNIARRAERFYEEKKQEGVEVLFSVVGRKGRDTLRRRRHKIEHEYMNVLGNLH